MTNDEKLEFFDANLLQIFKHKSNTLVGFINECSENNKLHEILNNWPDSIKIKVVDSFLLENE